MCEVLPPGGGRVEGILVTRVRLEQAKAEFERNLNHMLLNVEAAYWNLYAAYGTLWSPTSKTGCSTPFTSGYICTPGIAYQQVHDWMLGSTLQSCSVSGTTWTCGLAQSNGSQAEIIWDTSQTCSNGTCGSIQYSAPSIYLSYSDLSGATRSINGTVPVGIKPILLKTQ